MSMAYIALFVTVGSTIYGATEKNKAAKEAAKVDTATADYNAKYDLAAAAQLDLNTQQNIRTEREDAKVYLSRQEASYASAGVLTTTGSPLAARITNAGRFEQKIQQDYIDSQQRQQSLAASAAVGRLEGAAKADADRMQGTIALINGGSSVASSLYGGYTKGMFSVGKNGNDTGTTDPLWGG